MPNVNRNKNIKANWHPHARVYIKHFKERSKKAVFGDVLKCYNGYFLFKNGWQNKVFLNQTAGLRTLKCYWVNKSKVNLNCHILEILELGLSINVLTFSMRGLKQVNSMFPFTFLFAFRIVDQSINQQDIPLE